MLKLFAERGGDPDRAGKRNPLDALLWRMARPDEPSWDSELGAGRPGWHIECSVIATNRLGLGFDVQGGGSDLIFPHHEYSAAHAEAAQEDDSQQFARHYCHAGMIGLDGEKMSKSRGNLVFVSKLRYAGVEPPAIRLALLDGHYRDDRTWTDAQLTAAQTRLANWRKATALPVAADATDTIARLRTHLANDLDTPSALLAVDAWVAQSLTQGGQSQVSPATLRQAIDALLGVEL
jgi:L-cysteine:1D-myo-inositol 2-amino-2-deoxy-alpha-D-glucopyranoside ligase